MFEAATIPEPKAAEQANTSEAAMSLFKIPSVEMINRSESVEGLHSNVTENGWSGVNGRQNAGVGDTTLGIYNAKLLILIG